MNIMTTTTYKPISVMKKELRRIVRDIDEKLYSKLIGPLAIAWQTYEEFDTAESYFIEQLMNDELRPWTIAECLRNLDHPSIADNLEMFASTFDFNTKAMNDMDNMDRMEVDVKNTEPERVIMATDKRQMKKDLLQIARNIEPGLYKQLIDTILIPNNVAEELQTAKLYFIVQHFNEELKPWAYANALRTLNCISLAEQFEEFARKYNFTKTEPIQPIIENNPEKVILELLKILKSELSSSELLALRESKSKTFESIFADLLNLNKLTPSLKELRQKLQDENREDLASKVAIASQIVSQLDSVTFQRVVTLCLDTLDVDIFSLLSALREALSKEYSTYRTLSIHSHKFSLSTDFIPLTFTADVDTRTLPIKKVNTWKISSKNPFTDKVKLIRTLSLTEGSDAELLTLMENVNKQEKKETRYIDAHSEIYSSAFNGKLISLIGHPGTGKTFYCYKLVNEFINRDNVSYRFVLVISCRSIEWKTLEEQYLDNPNRESEMLERFLQIIIPSFTNSKDIVKIILNTEGNGLLLVIDSFDEFPQIQNFTATLLYRILKRQVLTRSTILITSRPGAWNQLLRDYGSEFSFDHSWQLLGFSPEQRDTFITTVLSKEKAQICQIFLSTKPELNILSLVPVNISLITSLVDSSTSMTHINTLTDMYRSLVVYTLDKELRRIDPSTPGIASLLEMPADMLQIFNNLAELSYHALLARQITFSSSEFPISNTKYTNGLGLFIVKVVTQHHTMIDYLSCPHLTLQEFLSAWHLAQKSPSDIKSIVQQTFSDSTWPAMKVCVRFLCGILPQGHNTIINIITDNLHRTSAPLLDCKYKIFESARSSTFKNLNYDDIHYDNTATHLSVLPYILETNQRTIISSYYKLLCPANSTMPHFYLKYNITPVDTYSLTQYFSLLPPNSTISVLSIDLTLLNNIQLDMLASSINITSIDTLLVTFRPITDRLDENKEKHSMKQYIEKIKYKIQQLHILNPHTHDTLLAKLNHLTYNTHINNIYELQYALSPLNLPIIVSNSDTQRDNIHIQKLISFIRNIANASCLHTPKHIYYQFDGVSFMDDEIMNTLIDTISSNATYVMLSGCHFSAQFITTLVTSLSKLEYLDIDDYFLRSLNKLAINALTFQELKERNMKGLYLHNVTLRNSTLCEYLQSQSTLQEIHLHRTTGSTLDTLHAIYHLTSLRYLHILADDNVLDRQHANSEETMFAYLTILHKNNRKLYYVDFSLYKYFIKSRYTTLMPILGRCHNLQYIDLSQCHLAPLQMHVLATTINQLPALLYINMSSNLNITDKGIITLTDTLATNNTVIWIDLSACRLSSAPVIISLINKFPCLLKIELRYNTDVNDTNRGKLKKSTKQRKIQLTIE